MELLCPCCSGLSLSLCCGPFIGGERLPATPLALMRSRYSAFALQNVDYLIATWHPDCHALDWRDDIAAQCAVTEWRGLTLVEATPGTQATEGYIEFIARFFDRRRQRPGFIHERSRFVRMNDRWYYVDGLHKQPARNDPCPCGSGKKYKKCCGA